MSKIIDMFTATHSCQNIPTDLHLKKQTQSHGWLNILASGSYDLPKFILVNVQDRP
jgi:hypothetical protein